jgi:shikimate dehydrogenase
MMKKSNFPKLLCLGLIGYPLGHSLSPTLHAAALAQYELQGEYRLYPVPPLPEGLSELKALMERLRRGELHGLNVTIPHKQSVVEWLDELTPAARAIGAVNTLINRDGRLVGDNTDAPGFWADIESLWGFKYPARALVLGSGGVARGMVYALAAHGWQVTIAAARPEDMKQAHTLASDLSPVGGKLDVIELNPALLGQYGNMALVVNATPLGMSPNNDISPWPEGVSFPLACKVYDAVYNPLETRFVRSARAAGVPAETGLGMLIAQAALAFERWTGLPAPFEVMRRSVR